MKIRIDSYRQGDDLKYMPGIARVYIDGELHAKVRTGESFEIEILRPEVKIETRTNAD